MKLIKLFLISLILFFVKTSFAKDFNVAALYWLTKIEGQVAMKFGIEEIIALLNKNSKSYEAVEPVGGKKAGQEILKDFPEKNSVDVIFIINDGGGISIAKELIAAKRDEIIHVTVDGDPESVSLIKNKKVTRVDSAQFCAEMGRQVAQVAWDYLAGNKYPKKVLVPVFPISVETI